VAAPVDDLETFANRSCSNRSRPSDFLAAHDARTSMPSTKASDRGMPHLVEVIVVFPLSVPLVRLGSGGGDKLEWPTRRRPLQPMFGTLMPARSWTR